MYSAPWKEARVPGLAFPVGYTCHYGLARFPRRDSYHFQDASSVLDQGKYRRKMLILLTTKAKDCRNRPYAIWGCWLSLYHSESAVQQFEAWVGPGRLGIIHRERAALAKRRCGSWFLPKTADSSVAQPIGGQDYPPLSPASKRLQQARSYC